MDTSVYRYVVEIEKCGSISAAARNLFISQPALTKQLGKLESHLGVKLFNRGKSRMTPTQAGEIFVDFASRYLDQERDMLDELGRIGKDAQESVLVAMTHRGGAYVGKYTPAFLELFPNISLEYVDASASDCEAAIENGTAEIAVYTDPVILDSLEYMPLEEDPLVLIVPTNSPLLAGKDYSNASLSNPLELDAQALRDPELTWVISTPQHSLYYAEQTLFKKLRITPAHTLKIDYVDTRYTVACNGGGIALFPTMTVRNLPNTSSGVCCTVHGRPLYRYVVIARKKGQQLSQSGDLFWRYMVSHGSGL